MLAVILRPELNRTELNVMTTEQLANTETELYSTVLDLYKKEQKEELNEKLKTVFAAYRQVHKHYSDLAKENDSFEQKTGRQLLKFFL